jgi:hypothetical protein
MTLVQCNFSIQYMKFHTAVKNSVWISLFFSYFKHFSVQCESCYALHIQIHFTSMFINIVNYNFKNYQCPIVECIIMWDD